jgi:hypothetical protein
MPDYVVQPGDCLYSIAQAHGFRDWRAIYNHPRNEEFRRRRPNPNVIYAGDVLFLPDLTPRQVPVPTGGVHTFRLLGLRTVLRLQLQNIDQQPIANADYVLEVEGTRHEGQTGSGGELEASIPPDARTGRLEVTTRLYDQDVQLVWTLGLGGLDPVEEATGIQARLNNLAFCCGKVDGDIGPRTQGALRSFCSERSLLDEDGNLPAMDTIRDALCAEHGL